MKRICLLGAVIAGLFIIGATTALASSPHRSTKATKSKPKPPPAKVDCSLAFALQAPAGEATVTQGSPTGNHAGSVVCRNKPLGRGVEFDAFTTDDAGDLTGKWQQWFNAGSVSGTYLLTPNDNQPPTAVSFTAASYTGTFVITNGTGVDAKAVGKGTMTCASQDSVHYTCKEKGKVTLPSATTAG